MAEPEPIMTILFMFLVFSFAIFFSRRYCFVQLKPDADIEQVKKDISRIEFGTGKISVENKITRHEVSEVRNKKITKMFWDICELLLNLLPINSCDLENTVYCCSWFDVMQASVVSVG